MIRASNTLVSSFYIRGSSDGWTFLSFYWKGLAPSLIDIMRWIILVSYVLVSSYVHANTSWYYLKRWMKSNWYCNVHHVLRFTNFRSFYIPILICSCNNIKLWVLAFTGPWNWFCKSYNFSSDTTPLGISFFCSYRMRPAETARACPCVSPCPWRRQC